MLDQALPSWRKLVGEGPAIARLIARQFRSPPVRCSPMDLPPVLVLPGFMTSDFHTRLLRRTIHGCGGRAFGWNQGFNKGLTRDKFNSLLGRFDKLARKHGPLLLLGWSLGGLYARELAKRRPDRVRMVVTLGTPFSHGPGRNHGKPAYNLLNDHDADHPPVAERPDQKPPVFTVACWSANEGMVAPISAAGEGEEADLRVRLACVHHDMVTDPDSVRTVLAILQAERALR